MRFNLWLEHEESQLEQLVQKLRLEYPGLSLWVGEHDHKINVTEIVVPTELRNQGIGSAVLAAIKDYAQSVGKPVTLSPEPGRGQKAALERFYKKNDFAWNSGRNKDYSMSSPFAKNMVWRPNKEGT